MSSLHAQQTEIQYLSGTGNNHTVNWQFFCTGGMNAGKWTTIPVPSCWELQGFGKYDYGFAKDSIRGKEKGLYKYQFTVPAGWKNKQVNLVFEGVMTDAEVKVNGKPAGEIHQGAFYSFKYDISALINFKKSNLLEVTVAKQSANASVNAAERKADFWLFGGIFRPVFLEALPANHISQVAIDAKADGTFRTEALVQGKADKISVQLYKADGTPFGSSLETAVLSAGMVKLSGRFVAPELWSTEFPNLYKAVFTLSGNGKILHTLSQKIGFRTVEVRQRDGLYVNGVKVKMKGVNRHSFWPTSGRTTSRELSIEDVSLMKDMNMNAVRMSHYPPDGHFLDVCDSLGLFVMDELTGWHGHYDTKTGTKLVKEMLDHDVNHPCIIFWSNGNEGGHNLELDHLFTEQDLQLRPVIHPWMDFGGFDTQHYREYNYGIGNYEHGHHIVMPTEFLHGLYDGGHGAGLEDYWEDMWRNPLSAGGFLWDFADEGVVRKDRKDSIDTDGNHGPDGIIGPFHEKEGSYFTIKEIWSPVHFEKKDITADFDGKLTIENRYHFTNINQCSFSWKLKRIDFTSSKEQTGTALAPSIKPGEKGVLQLDLPADWKDYDVLYVTAKDVTQHELFTWSFPVTLPLVMSKRIVRTQEEDASVQLKETDSLYQVEVKDIKVAINKYNGILQSVQNAKGILPFNNGPVLQEGMNNFQGFTYRFEGKNLVITSAFDKKKSYNTLQWTVFPSGWIKLHVAYFPAEYFTNFDGINFSFPESNMESVTYMGNGPYRVWKNRMKGTRFDVWTKKYNNTETGESWNYPEFKGYYSNFYGGFFTTKNQRFTVVTENEDLFLRLFTPAFKTDQWHNYEPLFPSGDISFMQGISSIGTKTQRNETTGPMGMKNIYYDYEKDPARALKMELYFDFSAK
jgi:beta-galactosidase/beta-glucuronidase